MLNEGVPHSLIVDNAGGYLMQKGMVDLVITGTDRTTFKGDVIIKTGTYLKALAAHDNNIPFYVALPTSTIDWEMEDVSEHDIIEKRNGDEIKYVEGYANNKFEKVLICPLETNAVNYAFDITPSKYITGLITEKGICKADEKEIKALLKR